MATLIDDLMPDELWALVEPLLQAPPRPPYGGPAPCHPRSQLLRRDRLHGPHLDTVAAPASPTARLRLAGDLLAPPGRMGRRRRVRPAPPGGVGPPWRARPGGLVTGECGHHERAGQAWGDHVGANPVDRGKPGSKLHLVCDGGGVPLSVVVTAANVTDTTMFQAVVEDIPPIRTPAGRRRTRAAAVHADKGYDSRANRAHLRRRGISARIARRGIESSARVGRHRWKVERVRHEAP